MLQFRGLDLNRNLIDSRLSFSFSPLPPIRQARCVGELCLSGLIERMNSRSEVKARRVACSDQPPYFQQYERPCRSRREIFRVLRRLKEIGVTTVNASEAVEGIWPAIERLWIEEFVSE